MKSDIWTIPNGVSLLRLFGIPLIFYFGLSNQQDVLVFVVFMVGGFTDWLDGYLARRLNQQSDFGAALDPVADRLYVLAAVVVLLIRGLIPLMFVVLIFARDIFMVCHLAASRRAGFDSPGVHYVGKAATMQLLYSLPLIFLGSADTAISDVARWFGIAFLVWGIFVYWYAAFLYVSQYRGLKNVT